MYNTVEFSFFGYEFLALMIDTELMEALRYNILCVSVYLDSPSNIFCDKNDAETNVSVPTSMLKNCHNAIFYHCMQKLQAAGNIQVGWIPGERKLTDLLMKTNMAGNVMHNIMDVILYNKKDKWKSDKTNDVRIG